MDSKPVGENLKDVKSDFVKPNRPDIVHGDYTGESTPLFQPPLVQPSEENTDEAE